MKVLYLYSSIHSKFLPLLGPSIYLLSLSGNKIQLPRLPRSNFLSLPRKLQYLSPGDFIVGFFFIVNMCILFIFFHFLYFLLILQIHKLKTIFPLTLPSSAICSLLYLYICMLVGLFIYCLVNRYL